MSVIAVTSGRPKHHSEADIVQTPVYMHTMCTQSVM